MDARDLNTKIEALLGSRVIQKQPIGKDGAVIYWVEKKNFEKSADLLVEKTDLGFDWLEDLSVMQLEDSLILTYFLRSSSQIENVAALRFAMDTTKEFENSFHGEGLVYGAQSGVRSARIFWNSVRGIIKLLAPIAPRLGGLSTSQGLSFSDGRPWNSASAAHERKGRKRVIELGPEVLNADLTEWEIGPYHGALPGPMILKLKLDGEIIVSADVEIGFLHRGLEKALELHQWESCIAYADHLDPEAAFAGELALCLGLEGLGQVQPPARAQHVRVILAELTRISAHLSFVVKMARAVGSETAMHYALRDREKVLDLFELLTGARFSLNFVRYGGVRADVTEGFIERVFEGCDLIQIRLREYRALLSDNHTFQGRTRGVGVIDPHWILETGMSGPNARAGGSNLDARRAHPYSAYEQFSFATPTQEATEANDAFSRFTIRLQEIAESVEILRRAAETLPTGPYLAEPHGAEEGLKIPRGEFYSRTESPRGLLGCHVVSDGGTKPVRIHFRSAAVAQISVIPKLLVGTTLEDLPVVLASLDICIPEADR